MNQQFSLTRRLVSALVFSLFASFGSHAFALPADLVVEDYADGLLFPVSMAVTPSGDLLVTEKLGTVRIVRDGQILDPPIV